MNEMTMNMGSMYEEVSEIQKLNRVEGFDPRRYMRTIQDEGQPARYYLDVAFRKLWFRLKYPEGKIVKHILKLTDQVAIVEARVYLNRNDEPDNFISNALAQKYMTADTQFGNKYVELAETAAVGRALSDAGFGLQFADREGDLDPEVTEAPMERRMLQGGGMPEEENTEILKETAGAGIMQEASEEDVNIPGQYGIEQYIPMPEEVGASMGMPPAMQQNPQPAPAAPAGDIRKRPQAAQTQSRGAAGTGNVPQGTGAAGNRAGDRQNRTDQTGISREMPVEQIYAKLNRDTAASVVIPMGYHKGKTLGQLALEKPKALEWYISSYGGPDNLLRAAAKFLLDAALGQAG